jgi:hypothetical protein
LKGISLRTPRPTIGSYSAYFVLGVLGATAAAIVVGLLAALAEIPLEQRLVIAFVPPLTFLATIRVARRRAGYERIVFFECVATCLVATAAATALLGESIARSLDLVTIGIGVFLVLGRIGCHRVACCHGRPARHGVRYGRDHAMLGFLRSWQGRPLAPVQLIESAASFVLVVIAISRFWSGPGESAVTYLAPYSAIRFALEELRGDRDRRYVLGLSEAQRMAVVCSLASAALLPSILTVSAASIVAIGAIACAARRRDPRRTLLRAGHIHELCDIVERLTVAASATTSAGLVVTQYELPDGRLDIVLSRDRGLPQDAAGLLAKMLDADAELVAGRTAGVVHVLIRRHAQKAI